MKIYRCYWEFNAFTEQTPYFTTKEKAKNYFWNMVNEKENFSLLEEVLRYYEDCHEENENLKDFVYNVLNGWDICGIEDTEVID